MLNLALRYIAITKPQKSCRKYWPTVYPISITYKFNEIVLGATFSKTTVLKTVLAIGMAESPGSFLILFISYQDATSVCFKSIRESLSVFICSTSAFFSSLGAKQVVYTFGLPFFASRNKL